MVNIHNFHLIPEELSSLIFTIHPFEDKCEMKEGDIRYEFLKSLKATGKELRRLKLALTLMACFREACQLIPVLLHHVLGL